jgi:hypothetical protein
VTNVANGRIRADTEGAQDGLRSQALRQPWATTTWPKDPPQPPSGLPGFLPYVDRIHGSLTVCASSRMRLLLDGVGWTQEGVECRVIDMNEAHVCSFEQVRQFLAGIQALEFGHAEDDEGRGDWVQSVLGRLVCADADWSHVPAL